MEILVAEDESNIAELYQMALEGRNHRVTLTQNGEECVEAYKAAMKGRQDKDREEKMRKGAFPFDVLVLDYRMPKKDGLQAAREILAINPRQRIIFASAYVKETLIESVENLRRIVELLQKPFDLDTLVDTIEDKQTYRELMAVNVKIKALQELNPTHEQLRDLLAGLQKLSKNSAIAKAMA